MPLRSAEFDKLPADLAAFLSAGQPLEFYPSPNGSTVAKPTPISELAVRQLEIKLFAPDNFGMHPDSVEVPPGPVQAIEVATICEGDYGDFRRLFWLPDVQRFAFYERTPDSMRVFAERLTWTVIASKPRWHLDGSANGALHRSREIPPAVQAAPALRERKSPFTMFRVRPSRWSVLWSIVGLVIAAIGIVWRFTSPPPGISVESYDRIELGMNEEALAEIIRAKPGWYGGLEFERSDSDVQWGEKRLHAGTTSGRKLWWENSYGYLEVCLDEEGRVCGKTLEYSPSLAPQHPEQWSWWKRLRNRQRPEHYRPAKFYFGGFRTLGIWEQENR